MSEPTAELSIRDRCTAELFDAQKQKWEDVRDEILPIERKVAPENPFTDEEFKETFDDPRATIVLLRDGRKIVGYTYAMPLLDWYDEDTIRKIAREDEGKKTAYVENTAIDPKYQGQRLTPVMMKLLESELIRKGYEFLERDVALANDYAAGVERHFSKDNRIIYKDAKPHGSPWGPQIFFRMKLKP